MGLAKKHIENVDYALMARTALADVVKLTEELEGVEKKTTMCREKWYRYGLALQEQRNLMPSKKEFGAWVASNKLDRAPADRHEVRANAMWMARNWPDVQRCTLTNHHPTSVRQECRDAGHDWAFDQKPEAKHARETHRDERMADLRKAAIPELLKAAKARDIGMDDAMFISEQPKAAQRKLLNMEPEARREALEELEEKAEETSVTDEWNESAMIMLTNLLVARAAWKREYGKEVFQPSSALLKLIDQAEKELECLKKLIRSAAK